MSGVKLSIQEERKCLAFIRANRDVKHEDTLPNGLNVGEFAVSYVISQRTKRRKALAKCLVRKKVA